MSDKSDKIKVYVKLWYPNEFDRPAEVIGVYKTKPDHATNESVLEFDLQE